MLNVYLWRRKLRCNVIFVVVPVWWLSRLISAMLPAVDGKTESKYRVETPFGLHKLLYRLFGVFKMSPSYLVKSQGLGCGLLVQQPKLMLQWQTVDMRSLLVGESS